MILITVISSQPKTTGVGQEDFGIKDDGETEITGSIT
jgi:hypothetical protein